MVAAGPPRSRQILPGPAEGTAVDHHRSGTGRRGRHHDARGQQLRRADGRHRPGPPRAVARGRRECPRTAVRGGPPQVQIDANHLLATFASATGATPIFLPAPGLLGSAAAQRSLMSDPAVQQVSARWSFLPQH